MLKWALASESKGRIEAMISLCRAQPGVAVTPGVQIFISATDGRIKVLASAGQQILGAQTANLTTVVTTTSTVVVTINRPFTQGQIT